MKALDRKQLIIVLAPLSLLLIPFIAMQFTPEVQWDSIDFVIGGFLILICSSGILLIRKLNMSPRMKLILWVTVIAAVLILWAEMAVGIFGSPIAGS